MENFDITKIEDFFSAIEEVKNKFGTVWFRGLTKKTYELEPSIYRSPYNPDLETNFLGSFMSKTPPFLDKMPKNDWEWLFIMQHYAVPTRLMDWTELPLVALAFALKNIPEKVPTEDALIYCLNPVKLNENVGGIMYDKNNSIPFINDKLNGVFGVGQTVSNNLPIAVIGPLNNHRIIAQKGAFTLFPHSLNKAFSKADKADDFLITLTLKKDKLEDLKKCIENAGITQESLFPGLDSISKEITKKYK
ncbi:FRG domain-containing protein [uncultured Maribacter sp.]|uniref:FRG domain-containing protein n=1 Tax=uncultured Maribacter sp. TaxID=431308 RepID=UPI002614907F|nr:FRG domain-containing protein [uncultured Maribacter sp.]